MYICLYVVHLFSKTCGLDVIGTVIILGLLYLNSRRPGHIITWSALFPRFILLNVLYYDYKASPVLMTSFQYLFNTVTFLDMLFISRKVRTITIEEIKEYMADLASGRGSINGRETVLFILPRLISGCCLNMKDIWISILFLLVDILMFFATLVGKEIFDSYQSNTWSDWWEIYNFKTSWSNQMASFHVSLLLFDNHTWCTRTIHLDVVYCNS